MATLALNLNSTRLICAVLGTTGKILTKSTTTIEKLAGAEVSKLIQSEIKTLLNEFKNKPMKIKSAGIAVPGIYYPKTGHVWAPNIPGWEDYPLKEDLLDIIRDYKLQVKIASKRTCNILGESWLGAAKGSKNAIYLSVSSGIGAGVLVDGKVLHGFNDGVGAVGWLCLNLSYKEYYKEKGFFEYHASGSGIVNLVKEYVNKDEKYTGHLRAIVQNGDLTIPINRIFDAYKKGDPIALKVIKNCIEYWGVASANLVNLFNPERVIFGGVVFGPASEYLPLIRKEAAKWAHPHLIKDVEFIESKLNMNAALFGAASLVNKKV